MNWALRIFILWVSTAQAGCDAPSNPVEAENCLPGSSEGDWRPQNTDPSIVGFASEISVNAGEIIFFKVDTDASNYRFDIYRLGYYGGSGARLIKTLSPFGPAQRQQACFEEGDFIDCGNWEVSAFWDIPADAVSGVYWVKLVRQDTGGENYFFFYRAKRCQPFLRFIPDKRSFFAFLQFRQCGELQPARRFRVGAAMDAIGASGAGMA